MKKSLLVFLIISLLISVGNIIILWYTFASGNSVESYKIRVFDLAMVSRINFIIGILLTIPTVIIGYDKKPINKKLFWILSGLIFFNAVIITVVLTVYSN